MINKSVSLKKHIKPPFGAYPLQYIDRKAKEPEYQGIVVSGTTSTLTDSSAEFIENQYVDKVVKIQKNGGADYQYAIIEKNDTNTLYFDDTLVFAPCFECVYTIIDTLVLSKHDLQMIIANNSDDYDSAIILPTVTKEIERHYLTSYIERGSNDVVMIGRKKDSQLGAKYGTLENFGEGVTLYAHTWDSNTMQENGQTSRPHWDVINLQGIKRLAKGQWINDENITWSDWEVTGAELALDYTLTRRFIPIVRDGIVFLRYTSLIRTIFNSTLNTIIEKSGGVGEMHTSLGIRRASNNTIEELTDIQSITRFGSGLGIETTSVNHTFELNRNDEIVVLTYRTAGTFAIKSGSTISITEV